MMYSSLWNFKFGNNSITLYIMLSVYLTISMNNNKIEVYVHALEMLKFKAELQFLE